MTISKKRRARLLAGALTAVAASACFEVGDNTFGIDDDDLLLTGTIVVSTNTFGASIDPDGYVAALDESRRQAIDVNGSVTFSSLKVGGYDVTLEGVALNCTVAASHPGAFMLFADSTVFTQFDVTCS
jgi:hypothetical protein